MEAGLHAAQRRKVGGSVGDASPSGEVALSLLGPAPGSLEEIAFSPPGATSQAWQPRCSAGSTIPSRIDGRKSAATLRPPHRSVQVRAFTAW